MHLNYYSLLALSDALQKRLKGENFNGAFSLNKEEIVLSFSQGMEELFMVLNLTGKTCLFFFHSQYNRPGRNFLTQFEELNNATVLAVKQTPYDRSFSMEFSNGYTLLFKLHGGFSNLILLEKDGTVLDIFRKQLEADLSLDPSTLAKSFDLKELISLPQENLYEVIKKKFPVITDDALKFLQDNKFADADLKQRENIFEELMKHLLHPKFYSGKDELGKAKFSMFSFQGASFETADVVEAYNDFSRRFKLEYVFNIQKKEAANILEQRIKQTEKELSSTMKHLEMISGHEHYEELANIVMANLHAIEPRKKEAELFDFYHDKIIKVRLDGTISPQENASRYYKKAKNFKREVDTVREKARILSVQAEDTRNLLNALNVIPEIKQLREFISKNNLNSNTKEEEDFPFRRSYFMDYEIWIGKNSANNEKLTHEYAHKNDLWLHARGVPGSHVVLRHKPGKEFPMRVIEAAAALAAFYSKGKTNTLCPVQYTFKKFVRRNRKGNPGEVVLEKEDVILVEPKRELGIGGS